MRCNGCGNSSLIEGDFVHSSDAGQIRFSPSGNSNLKKAFGIGSRPARCYGCLRCGNMQMAIEFSEEDMKKYQSFEGEQQRSAVEEPKLE